MTTIELAAGQVVSGPQFSEPMRVETVQSNGAGIWVVGLVGIRSEQFLDLGETLCGPCRRSAQV